MNFFHARFAYLSRLAIIVAACGGLFGACKDQQDVRPSPIEGTIFDNGNVFGVFNSPTAPTVFSINNSYKITLVQNYHWNDAHGQPGGTISLTSATGVVYGPWSVTTLPGQGGVPNAFWAATPNVIIPAGTYTVGDSSPTTWSQNSQSGGCGFSTVNGILQ